MTDATLRQALAFATTGWPVLPCLPGQKIPATALPAAACTPTSPARTSATATCPHSIWTSALQAATS